MPFHQTISSSTKKVIMQPYFKAQRSININNFQPNMKNNPFIFFEMSIVALYQSTITEGKKKKPKPNEIFHSFS